MKLGIYVRVSTQVQTKGESLADQEHDARSWAAAHGHDVVEVYSDPGLSGRLPAAERPGLAATLDDVGAGVLDGLVVRDLDRLARELTVQEAVLAQVWRHPGAAVYTFAGEVLRDDPEDPMRTAMRQMAGVFAELDRGMVSKKLRDARRNKARRGGHANGHPPYGWTTTHGELRPVPAEQAALDRMRDLAAAGLNQADIAATLTAEGHPTKRGGTWSQPVVSRILRRDADRSPAQVAHHAAQLAKHGSVGAAS